MITCLTQAASALASTGLGGAPERHSSEGEAPRFPSGLPLIDFGSAADNSPASYPVELLTGDAGTSEQPTSTPVIGAVVGPGTVKRGHLEKDKYNVVQEVVDAAHLGRELVPEEAKLVFDSAAEFVKMQAKQEAHWEAEARIHLQSDGFRHGTDAIR